jgi:hypothetical protein
MRFMMIVRAQPAAEDAGLSTPDRARALGKFNEDMVRAGVLLAVEALRASADGTRIKFTGGRRRVIQGPFDPRELISGFWLIQVRSRDEALQWAARCPFADGEELELREVAEVVDFPPETAVAQAKAPVRIETGSPALRPIAKC